MCRSRGTGGRANTAEGPLFASDALQPSEALGQWLAWCQRKLATVPLKGQGLARQALNKWY